MPLKALLDPQGKAVSGTMKNLQLSEITNVRIGKHITLEVEAKGKKEALILSEEACKKLLCNQVMETYSIRIED